MFCTECGATISATDHACPACGTRVNEGKPALRLRQTNNFPVLSITRAVLRALSEGKVIRTAVALTMQILAVVLLLGGIYLLVELLKASSQMPAGGTIGGILLAVIMVAAIFAVSQINLYRAQAVRELPDSQFTIIPIISILLRTAGEVYAVLAVAAAIGGCLFIWFSGASPGTMLSGVLPWMPSIPSQGQSFIDGLIFLVWFALAGFISLVAFYGAAELVVVTVDIASNVRLIARSRGAEAAAGAGAR
ncbi:MAG TPA: zinc ribbon domain-containing protein [Terriglobales bacterium]|nr:zinc ribbon domain-containing protein [Terriglobales bacterium]